MLYSSRGVPTAPSTTLDIAMVTRTACSVMFQLSSLLFIAFPEKVLMTDTRMFLVVIRRGAVIFSTSACIWGQFDYDMGFIQYLAHAHPQVITGWVG